MFHVGVDVNGHMNVVGPFDNKFSLFLIALYIARRYNVQWVNAQLSQLPMTFYLLNRHEGDDVSELLLKQSM